VQFREKSKHKTSKRMHHHTKSSKKLQELREEPQIGFNLPSGGPLRNMVRKIAIKSNGAGSSKSRGVGKGGITTVYYLVGDERRAVRKFIKENQNYINSCFSEEHNNNCNNPLREDFDEFMFALFEEEYEIMEYNGEI
jgi:hypothetical protein